MSQYYLFKSQHQHSSKAQHNVSGFVETKSRVVATKFVAFFVTIKYGIVMTKFCHDIIWVCCDISLSSAACFLL